MRFSDAQVAYDNMSEPENIGCVYGECEECECENAELVEPDEPGEDLNAECSY